MARTIAIIGSAGRGDDGLKFRSGLFERMVERVKEAIRVELKFENKAICLISGGGCLGRSRCCGVVSGRRSR